MIPRVIVGGLGPAGPELLTAQVVELASTHPSFLRTARHPAASQFDLPSFDHVYESAETFEEVYASIVESLVAAAGEHSTVGYLVPGSPLVAERTVELLRLDTRVETQILPAVSFLDVSWVALGIDPIEAGVRLIDGHRFLVEAAGERCWCRRFTTARFCQTSNLPLIPDTSTTRPVTPTRYKGCQSKR